MKHITVGYRRRRLRDLLPCARRRSFSYAGKTRLPIFDLVLFLFFFQSLSILISVFPDLVNDHLGTYFKHDNVVQRDVSGGFNIATTFFLQATHLSVYRTNPVLRKGKRTADVSSLIFFNQSYLHLSVRIFRRSILARKLFSTIAVKRRKRRKRSRTTQMSEDHDGYFNELTDLFYTL